MVLAVDVLGPYPLTVPVERPPPTYPGVGVDAPVRLEFRCAFAGRWESGGESRNSVSAFDCSVVRQRRLTSSFRLARPDRKFPTRSCTAALVPRHRLPVASALAQPQTASSALKSGLYPWQVYQPQVQGRGVRRVFPQRLATMGRRIVPGSRSAARCASPRSCFRKATEVPELLLLSTSSHLTSPVSRHTAE